MFRIINRADSIKKLQEYFNTGCDTNVGILFVNRADGIKLLDEVKANISKADSEVWNKTFLLSKNKERFIVENCRNPEKIFSGWSIQKFFTEYSAFVKCLDNICDNIICIQGCMNPENVENFIICDSEEQVNSLREMGLKWIKIDSI